MLSVNQLSGGYLNRRIINDITFDIQPGEIVGLIGLNGAGKSTTIRHMTGVLKPHSGNITIDEKDWMKQREKLAHIPDKPELYPNLTIMEHFQFIKRIYQLNEDHYVNQLIDRYALSPHLNKYPHALSKGTQQKVSIISALISNPTYLVVDEPFMGLDPQGLKFFKEDLIRLKNEGLGMIISTHLLSIAEHLCDRIIVLHRGRQQRFNDKSYLTTEDVDGITLEDLFFSMIEEQE
jgi:ABC-2 type transport system ATP-binding protein